VDNVHTDGLKNNFFDLSLDLLCVLDAAGRVQVANRAFGALVGHAPQQMTGQPFSQFIHDDDRDEARAVLASPGQEHAPVSTMCRVVCHDATLRWYMWTAYPHEAGRFNLVGRDMTPYHEMEDKETERNIFAEALLDTVLAINSSLSLEQVLERILSNVGRVVAYDYVNIMLLDGDRAEIAGIQFRDGYEEDVTHPQNRRFHIRHSDYLRTMYDTQESLIVRAVDNPPVWMAPPGLSPSPSGSFLGAPVVVEDEVIGFLGVFNTTREFFTPLHARHLVTFANQAGSAIKNARLYEQAATVAVLKERQRMAQELHDSVNQNLFAASTYADLLPRALNSKPEAVARYAADISRLVRGAVAQMRMILIELHPDTLTKTELSILIKQQCDAFSSHTGIAVNFSGSQQATIARDDQIALYRIAQEALHNIDRHANATQVDVHLAITDTALELHIADNGTGFDMASVTDVQFGVRNMHDRTASIGAAITIDSQPGTGTRITLRKDYHAST
jgi:PAS domain S-box-containing protein